MCKCLFESKASNFYFLGRMLSLKVPCIWLPKRTDDVVFRCVDVCTGSKVPLLHQFQPPRHGRCCCATTTHMGIERDLGRRGSVVGGGRFW